MGPLRYIGNPGIVSGPFRKLCALGEAGKQPDVYSLHRWTWRDKHAALEPRKAIEYQRFIEQERETLPEFEFRRLYEAEWTEDEAAVFRNVHEVTDGPAIQEPNGDRYVIGVDVGQQVDYLAAVVLGVGRNRADHMERFRGVGYPQAAQRLKSLQSRFNDAPLVVEVNGVGIALAQELDRANVQYIPFTTTSQTKQDVILSLASDFQEKRIKLAEMPPLQYELSVFRYQRSPTGHYRYEAPQGEHDDTVMALALARWAKARAVTDIGDYGWVA